jgi:sepiapterin reductase
MHCECPDPNIMSQPRKKHLVIITGSSRGFGRSLALAFAARVKCSLHLVLTARSIEDLRQTQELVSQVPRSAELSVEIIAADLSNREQIDTTVDSLFRDYATQFFSDAIFVNNAGSLGEINSVLSKTSLLASLDSIMDLNFKIPCVLISEFLKRFQSARIVQRIAVVNVSSLWALQPAKTFSEYCTSKAALEMFLKTLALETKNEVTNKVRVLNYAPGPLDTEMQRQIRESDTVDKDVQSWSLQAFSSDQLISPNQSAIKCVRLVLEELYATGDHIDYFDRTAGIEEPLAQPTTCCGCTYCECGTSCECGVIKAPLCDSCVEYSQK